MVANRLILRTIFNRSSHPCDGTDVMIRPMIGVGVDTLSAVIITVGVGMLSDMEIVRMANPEISLDFAVPVTYVVDIVADALTALIVGSVTAADVDMLADETANGFAAVMTPLEFTLSLP